jgi:hypothetical protein
MVAAHPAGSFFHTTVWAKVLVDSYGYRPVYFAVIENGELRALLPVMEIDSILTGKRGVSLPFSDYADPFWANEDQYRALAGEAVRHGRESGWKTLEIRGGASPWEDESPSFGFLGHRLDLARSEKEIYAGFRTNMKRNISRSQKEGVKLERSNSPEAMEEYFKLHCITRQGHGIPPQPLKFFRKITEHVLQRDMGFIILSKYREKIVAGAVYFHHGKKAIYKYGASNREGKDSRANNLVMWEAIRWYRDNGYRDFCFGRTEPENEGLKEYKSGYGSTEYTLPYYKFDIAKNRVIKMGSGEGMERIHNYYRQVPIPVSRIIGSFLYRHIG